MVTYEICTSIDGFYYYIKTRAQTLKSHPYSWIFAQHRLQDVRKCINHLPLSSASVVSIKNGRSSYFPFIHIAAKILHFRFDLHSVLGHLVTVRPMTPSWVVQTMFDPLSLLDVRFLEHEIYWITLSIPPTAYLTSPRISWGVLHHQHRACDSSTPTRPPRAASSHMHKGPRDGPCPLI